MNVIYHNVIYHDTAPFIMHSETAKPVDSLEELLAAAVRSSRV